MAKSFSSRLLKWYYQHGRKNLPWQKNITPYRVWVSEIMLQQTQVDTVVDYYTRFMQRFKNVKALSEAPIDEVLHLWTGLGYYARARNLHKCAQVVCEQYKGRFPKDVDQLAELPGIGRSTAAAIASIAYEQPTAILDGNVKRVLSRHHAVEGWPGGTAVANKLWAIAEANMPQTRCRDYTQAIMDLGATLCTRSKPQCPSCPVYTDCLARQQDNPTAYPHSKPKKEKPIKQAYLLILQNEKGEVLLQQRPPQGIWGGLWCLPEISADDSPEFAVKQISKTLEHLEYWSTLRHTFSHYHFDITPVHALIQAQKDQCTEPGQLWYDLQAPQNVGLAAPVKRLLQQLQQSTQQRSLAL